MTKRRARPAEAGAAARSRRTKPDQNVLPRLLTKVELELPDGRYLLSYGYRGQGADA